MRHVVGNSRERLKQRRDLVGGRRRGQGEILAVWEGKAVVRMLLMEVVMVVRHEMGIRKIRHGHRKVRDDEVGLLKFGMTGSGLLGVSFIYSNNILMGC